MNPPKVGIIWLIFFLSSLGMGGPPMGAFWDTPGMRILAKSRSRPWGCVCCLCVWVGVMVSLKKKNNKNEIIIIVTKIK